MSKMKVKSLNISGMWDSYEAGCQRILWLGLEWIKDKPVEVWKDTYSYRNIAGILVTGERLDGLEKILADDTFLSEGGITGAMHQFSLSHLHHIHTHSYRKWVAAGEKMKRIIETEQEVSPELASWLSLDTEVV